MKELLKIQPQKNWKSGQLKMVVQNQVSLNFLFVFLEKKKCLIFEKPKRKKTDLKKRKKKNRNTDRGGSQILSIFIHKINF